MTCQTPKTEVQLKKELDYYLNLDDKGQIIHDYIKKGHTTAVKLFHTIEEEFPKDYRFSKDEKRQQRDIKKYNYEVNFQKYCGKLARTYKRLTGKHAQKFKKYIKTKEEEEKEDFIRDEVEDEKQEEAIVTDEGECSIADKIKHTGGSCMYPIKFKDKDNNIHLIIDIAREILKENPPSLWEEVIDNVDQKEKITCECGREVQRKSMNRHLQTNIHKKSMKKN